MRKIVSAIKVVKCEEYTCDSCGVVIILHESEYAGTIPPDWTYIFSHIAKYHYCPTCAKSIGIK